MTFGCQAQKLAYTTFAQKIPINRFKTALTRCPCLKTNDTSISMQKFCIKALNIDAAMYPTLADVLFYRKKGYLAVTNYHDLVQGSNRTKKHDLKDKKCWCCVKLIELLFKPLGVNDKRREEKRREEKRREEKGIILWIMRTIHVRVSVKINSSQTILLLN